MGGQPRKLVALANRNAFYYLLDRETGEFVLGREYSKQTWAESLNAKGRPILLGAEVGGNRTYQGLAIDGGVVYRMQF